MSENGLRIGIFGAGAVGGYVGGHLARAGHDVTLIGQWPEHVERVKRDGLRLRSTEGETIVRPAILHLHEVQSLFRRPLDVVFLCVKSYDTAWATAMISSYLSPAGFIASMQNGMNEERIAAHIGWGRTLGVVLNTIGVNSTEPGTAMRTSRPGGAAHTVFRVGEPDGRVSPRAVEVARLLTAVDSAEVTTNLWGERWSKLVANSISHGLSTVSGLNSRAVLASPELRQLTTRLVAEGVRVGQALGYALVDIYGTTPAVWTRADRGETAAAGEIERSLRARLARVTEAERPSAAQDLARGRRTELDYTNGLIVERACALRIPAPVQEALLSNARAVEAGSLAPSIEHVLRLGRLLAPAA
ncbi:MAG: ketopantoate reductase family protein [Burkholderiales bacterium]